MTFDSNISDEVSMSKILDYFLENGESKTVILDFLVSHEDDIEDILKYSDCSSMLFQLDFIYHLKNTDIMKLYKVSKMANGNVVDYFVWQIMTSNLPNGTKELFRNLLHRTTINHPYSGIGKREISAIDTIFFRSSQEGDSLVDMLNRLKIGKFSTYVQNLKNSLFAFRFLQNDIFDNLTPDRQYIVINGLSDMVGSKRHWYNMLRSDDILSSEIPKFMKKVLCSPIDDDVKYEMLNTVFRNGFRFNLRDEIKDIFEDVSSYAELSIKMNIFGIERYADMVILYMVEKAFENDNYLKMLVEFEEYDNETMKEYFDICGLVEYMKMKLKKH